MRSPRLRTTWLTRLTWLGLMVMVMASVDGNAEPGAPGSAQSKPAPPGSGQSQTAQPQTLQPQSGQPQSSRPVLPVPALPATTPTVPGAASVPVGDPALGCYEAARRGAHDAYVCDLAVQVAQDGGSPRALAAALNNRALVLAADGRLEPALADLDAALEQTPDDPVLFGDRGNLLLRLNRPADALAAYDRAVQLAPDDPRSYYNRAFGYRALGEPERAEQDVRAVQSLLQRAGAAVTSSGTPAAGARPPR